MVSPPSPSKPKSRRFWWGDAKLAALRRKKGGLEAFKSGLMQQLFSQTLRFTRDDGTDFPDWENAKLAEALLLHRERVSADTDIPIFSSARDELKPQKDFFADREIQNDGDYGVVPDGFITFRHMSDDLTFHFNKNTFGHSIAVSKEYPVFTKKAMNSEFLLAWLNNSKDFATFAIAQKKGGTRTRLHFNVLKELRIVSPHPDEQRKIADALSALDAKINGVAGQIALMQTFKQGLLQQMFV